MYFSLSSTFYSQIRYKELGLWSSTIWVKNSLLLATLSKKYGIGTISYRIF